MGTYKIKKGVIIITLFIIIFMILFDQKNYIIGADFIYEGQYMIIKLPYNIPKNCTSVFDEDTPLAIDIIKITADGNILSYIDDIRSLDARTYWKTRDIIFGQKTYFISMYWEKCSPDSIRWNNGEGIIFNEIEPNVFRMSTKSFELVRGMNNVEIEYRILLPDSLGLSMTTEISDLNKMRYSEIYTISIDLTNVWDSAATP